VNPENVYNFSVVHDSSGYNTTPQIKQRGNWQRRRQRRRASYNMKRVGMNVDTGMFRRNPTGGRETQTLIQKESEESKLHDKKMAFGIRVKTNPGGGLFSLQQRKVSACF